VLGSGATTAQRTDNGVSYFLPKNLGGWFGQVHVAAGEGVVGNKYTGGRVGFENSTFLVGGAIGQTDVGSTQPKFKNYNLLFNYKSPWGTLHTLFDVKKWGPRKAQELSIGATVPVTQAGSIRLGYTSVNRSGGAAGSGYADADDSTRVALGYVHEMSKRTALYGTYATISNKGAARSSVLYTTPTGMRGGENSSGMEVGVRHSF
jgi:predicted porin